MEYAGSVSWVDLAVADLDVATLYDVLVLRSAVFVVEQDCVYQDPDGLDLLEGTRHLIGRQDGIAAYARVLAPDAEHPTPRIGRVIVSGRTRGQQLGRRLMERALASCEEHWPGEPVELGAQAHLAGFYGSLGFAAVGEPYDEDGILHVWMRREAG
jgi:ElaA protein